MKKLLLTLLLAMALVLPVNAETKTITITPKTMQTGSSSSTYVTTPFTFEADGYTFSTNQVNPSDGQMKVKYTGNSGFSLTNTTAIPNIKSVKFTATASGTGANIGTWAMKVGDTAITATATTSDIKQTETSGNTRTFTIPQGATATYFKINLTSKGGGTVKFSKIEITYEETPAELVDAENPFEALSLEVNDGGTFTSTIADFMADVKNLSFTSSDEDGLLVDGIEYVAMNEGTYTVTATWEAGSIYNASPEGGYSFEVVVTPATPKFEFKSATHKATLGESYTLPELTNTYDVKEYTLTSSDEAVAVLSPVDGKSLWIVGEGTTTITATLAGQEGVTASYELTVSAPAALVEDAVTFNFNVEEAYGMTATDNGNFYLDDNFSFNEGEVKISIEKNGGSGARLWKNKNGTEFELSILKTSKLTISVPTGYITRVEFTEGAAHSTPKFSFSQLSGASMTWTPAATEKVTAVSFSGTDRSDIASIKVIYATEKEVSITTPDLKFSKLIAFGDMATIKGTATAGEATVGYLAGEGAEIEADGDNWIVSADETGEYDVTAYVAPAEGVVPAVKHGKLIVKPFPEKVYMIGHYYDRYYDIATPIVLTHQGNGKYTHTDKYILLGGSADEGDFGVVFTTSTLAGPSTEVAERRKVQEHATDWAALTDGEVIHAGGIHSADEITAASDLTSFVPTTGGGKYVISLDLANSAPAFETYSGVETGIEDVTVEQGEATYYAPTGHRVANPSAGAYIRVQGGKAQKVMFK